MDVGLTRTVAQRGGGSFGNRTSTAAGPPIGRTNVSALLPATIARTNVITVRPGPERARAAQDDHLVGPVLHPNCAAKAAGSNTPALAAVHSASSSLRATKGSLTVGFIDRALGHA
jgi:hypothetical protein